MAIVNFNSISGVSTISATSSITVGDVKLNPHSVAIGTTDTTGRNAGVSTATGTLIYNTTNQALELYSQNTWSIVKRAFSATGGTQYTASNGKIAHVFTEPGDFILTGSGPVEYFMVGGGGGGGAADGGGGGGAGGVMTNIPGIIPAPATGSAMPMSSGSYPVVVGTPGAKSTSLQNPGAPGSDGGDSTFNSITAGGGGGGGAAAPPQEAGRAGRPPGGSGGGGGASGATPIGGGAGPDHGNNGASSGWMNWGGGGGGGAGANGASGTGGVGVAAPTNYVPGDYGTPGPSAGRWFAGGGGGGHGDPTNSDTSQAPAVAGGAGGGGNGELGVPGGSPTEPQVAGDGVANTGGGGGGRDVHDSSNSDAGAGGSGIVILFYD